MLNVTNGPFFRDKKSYSSRVKGAQRTVYAPTQLTAPFSKSYIIF